ncbi:polyunsaturated fatty acid 5-lipoxygenase-like isoform X2 [Oratosquilla oratoria]|uniref:polyunsaturated fatty acid 5-lipoxygenase-like isoform X2 n=1 Tax=Oratosquilla oratoria TaxID=337810 RepID=UPI003F7660BB
MGASAAKPTDGSLQMTVWVRTGNQLGAGTNANVTLRLIDHKGTVSPTIKLDRMFHDDLERGSTDYFPAHVPPDFGKVVRIELERDSTGLGDAWYCEGIKVEDPRVPKDDEEVHGRKKSVEVVKAPCTTSGTSTKSSETSTKSSETSDEPDINLNGLDLEEVHLKREYFFPISRWVKANHTYSFEEYDTKLPQQHPPECQQRKQELLQKREAYQYTVRVEGGPCQVETLPADERFSESYYWDFTKRKSKLLTTTIFTEWTQTSWNSLDDLKSVYSKSLGEPYPMRRWKEDRWFGLQRVQGVNPVIIQLCTSLPENLDVTDATLEGLLDDLTLEEALEKKKMFICNLDILDGLDCKDDKELAAPIALFYLDKDDKLNPVAIQLRQQKGEDNPVYTPNDSPNTWLVAKMFYNNAEAQHHQALTHLGFTHLLMEGVVVCTHRNLSPSHPLFKLLAPHFLFLLAINERGLRKLVSPGGWVDRSMTQGVKGIFNLIKRGLEQWRFDIHGKPETFLRHNGTLDPEVLPYYPYRDDALLLHNEIEKYVTQVVQHHYDTPEKLAEDWELQWWREELVKQRQLGGVGLEGVPGDPVKGFCKVEEVIETVTVIISTCSLGHSAANFQQYEQYAFVPNYPGILMEDPPKTKREYDEKDIMKLLPNKRTTLDIMVITNLLSSKGTKSLGDFEMQYLYDPVGVRAAEEFRKNLKKASCIVNIRNLDRELEFDWLNPAIVPNSISV